MNKGIKTALTVCLILAVIGVGLVIVGIALGGRANFSLDWKNRKIIPADTASVRGELTPEAFTALEIDVSTADITVERGEGWSLRYALSGEPEITQENGMLKLQSQKRGSIGFVGISFDAQNARFVAVTVPEDVSLETITLCTGTGSVTLSDIEAGVVTVECDTGDAVLNDVTVRAMNVDCDTGSLELQNVTAAERAELETDTGDIAAESLTAPGGVSAETDTGSISLSLTGDEAAYNVSLETDLGDVIVNGREQGRRYASGSGAAVRAETNTGDVRVRFG